MSKIEEYLNSLDKKNIFMLYISVFVLGFIVYYNYNYNVLQKTIEQNSASIEKLKNKNKKNSHLLGKVSKLKEELKKLKSKNSALEEDFKYLSVLVKTSKVINIDENSFFDILKTVLQSATLNDIQASYSIKKDLGEYKTYEINVKGRFSPQNFINFYDFIKSIEKIKYIKKIVLLDFAKTKEDVTFDMIIKFWSLR